MAPGPRNRHHFTVILVLDSPPERPVYRALSKSDYDRYLVNAVVSWVKSSVTRKIALRRRSDGGYFVPNIQRHQDWDDRSCSSVSGRTKAAVRLPNMR